MKQQLEHRIKRPVTASDLNSKHITIFVIFLGNYFLKLCNQMLLIPYAIASILMYKIYVIKVQDQAIYVYENKPRNFINMG